MAVSKVCRRRQALYTVNGKRGSGMWCITPQMEGISRGRVCPGSQLRPYRFSAFWLRSSVVSVLISLISDTSPIWGLHIKPIFGPGSWIRSLLRSLRASARHCSAAGNGAPSPVLLEEKKKKKKKRTDLWPYSQEDPSWYSGQPPCFWNCRMGFETHAG